MIRINLLPRVRVRRAPPLVRIGAAVVVVLLIGAGVWTVLLNRQIAATREQIAEVNRQIEELQPKVARVEQLKRLIEAAERKEQLLRRLEAARIPWSQVLLEVRTVIPRDVWLTQISAATDRNLVFNGFGLSYTAVARFMVSLEASDMFEQTDLTVSQKQRIGERDVISFSVTSKLTPRAEATVR